MLSLSCKDVHNAHVCTMLYHAYKHAQMVVSGCRVCWIDCWNSWKPLPHRHAWHHSKNVAMGGEGRIYSGTDTWKWTKYTAQSPLALLPFPLYSSGECFMWGLWKHSFSGGKLQQNSYNIMQAHFHEYSVCFCLAWLLVHSLLVVDSCTVPPFVALAWCMFHQSGQLETNGTSTTEDYTPGAWWSHCCSWHGNRWPHPKDHPQWVSNMQIYVNNCNLMSYSILASYIGI